MDVRGLRPGKALNPTESAGCHRFASNAGRHRHGSGLQAALPRASGLPADSSLLKGADSRDAHPQRPERILHRQLG
jgi:hypothetical protein